VRAPSHPREPTKLVPSLFPEEHYQTSWPAGDTAAANDKISASGMKCEARQEDPDNSRKQHRKPEPNAFSHDRSLLPRGEEVEAIYLRSSQGR
jgi:hypothetical protein